MEFHLAAHTTFTLMLFHCLFTVALDPFIPNLIPLSHWLSWEFLLCCRNKDGTTGCLCFLLLTHLAKSYPSAVCLVLCQVPVLGVGLSTAAVWVKYKCLHRPGAESLQAENTACLCAHVCVQVCKSPQKTRSELTGLSVSDLGFFFLPLNIFPAAHPVSRRDRNSPWCVLSSTYLCVLYLNYSNWFLTCWLSTEPFLFCLLFYSIRPRSQYSSVTWLI